MSFSATKREWSELYTFFKLLSEGKIHSGTPQGKIDETVATPIAMIQRGEQEGIRNYYINNDAVHITGENIDKTVAREDFGIAANLILEAIKESKEDNVESPDEVEAFLDELKIYDLEALTNDRTDLSFAFQNPEAPLTGYRIYSRMGKMNPLLDGGRAANLKFEQTGIKFATPTVNKVNALDTDNEVADRMMMIERLGGVLKYSDVADRVFRGNLLMIDLHFPRLLAEMVRIMHLDGITKVSELTEVMKQLNPLKIKEELISKHGFYEFKIKQFLIALALGMRPAKIYKGNDSAINGVILVNGNGDIVCYQKADNTLLEDFLYYNTRFEKGATEKDKYGYLEKENGIYYFKLNVKVGIVKR